MRARAFAITLGCSAVLTGCGNDGPQGPEIPETVPVEIVLDSWALDDPGVQRDSLQLWRGLAEILHTEPLPAAGEVVLRHNVPCERDGTLTNWYLNFYVTWVGEREINRQCPGGSVSLDSLQCTDRRQIVSNFQHDSAYCTPPDA
jgi:hypothetical protein